MSLDDRITTWLEAIGLAQYASVFAENAVDLDILPDVTEADLERLGVALGDRKRMLRAIGCAFWRELGHTVISEAGSHRSTDRSLL
jgi:SAM domain (Sterile alpha motif)